MQQPPQMIPVMPSFPPTNITTEQIQKQLAIEWDIISWVKVLFGKPRLRKTREEFKKCLNAKTFDRFLVTDNIWYLDENKKLILLILDNQNLGKLAECAQYQAQLQKNLMYLAAIADAQPQTTPTMPPQMAPHPAMQPGGYFMQHPQAAAMAQQPGLFPQKVPLQFNSPHQMQDPQQHQQIMQGQMGIRPGGPNNGIHSMHADAPLGGGSSGGLPPASGPNDGRGGNKQEGSEAGADGHGGVDGAEETK